MGTGCKLSGGFRSISSHASQHDNPTVGRGVVKPGYQRIVVCAGVGQSLIALPVHTRMRRIHDRLGGFHRTEVEAQRLQQAQRPLIVVRAQQNHRMLLQFRQRSGRGGLQLGGHPAVALQQSAQLRDR